MPNINLELFASWDNFHGIKLAIKSIHDCPMDASNDKHIVALQNTDKVTVTINWNPQPRHHT